MKKIAGIFMTLLIIISLSGCNKKVDGISAADDIDKPKTQNAATGTAIYEEPVNDSLKEKDIKSASVLVRPDCFPPANMGNKKVKLGRDEIREFTTLFQKVSLTEKMISQKSAEESTGQFIQFDLTLRNDTKKSVIVCSPFITYNGTTYKTEYEPSEGLNEFANRIISEKIVNYQCDAGYISLFLPNGWSHKIQKYKKVPDDKTWDNNETFGITFWKNKSKKNSIFLQYTKCFGICGTGLKTKKMKINGMHSEVGYYNGKTYWEYIHFLNDYENFVVLNFCESENWWNTNGDQVMEILDTLTLEKNA